MLLQVIKITIISYQCNFLIVLLFCKVYQQYMNDRAKVWNRIWHIKIFYIYLAIVDAQTYLQASVIKSVSLPISTINEVPYLNLQHLCGSEITQEIVGSPSKAWPEDSSEFQQLINYSQESDVMVLLDTGSKEFWLADNSCSHCIYTKNFCPHLSIAERKNTYVKGFIEGVDSYINLCSNRVKFMCVKSIQGFGKFFGHGILGLQSGTTGFNMLFNILKKRPAKTNYETQLKVTLKNQKSVEMITVFKQIHAMRFVFGSFKNNFGLEHEKRIYKVNKMNQLKIQQHQIGLKVGAETDWSFNIEQILIMNEKINFDASKNEVNTKAYVDTGSSKIVLPTIFCKNFFKIFENKFGLTCRYVESQGIDCDRLVHSFQFAIKVRKGQTSFNANSKIKNILMIDDDHLIDPVTNRIQVLCQQELSDIHVLLGHPFLKSFDTSFEVETDKQIGTEKENSYSTSYSIKFVSAKQNVNFQQVKNKKLMITTFLILICICAAATLYVLDLLRSKRSTKIII